MRKTIDSLLSKTINELTNQSSDSETFGPRERIKELELRTQRRNSFEEELFKDMFHTEEELAYHRELLVVPTQYYMKNPEQAFVEYASSRTDKAGEQNRNPSSPKRVHFVNSIIILNNEDEAKEEGSVKSSVTENKDHDHEIMKANRSSRKKLKRKPKKKRKITQNISTLSSL
ncbi:hypothetical protein Tco_0270522 [Tanacetum coccineum]